MNVKLLTWVALVFFQFFAVASPLNAQTTRCKFSCSRFSLTSRHGSSPALSGRDMDRALQNHDGELPCGW